MVGMILREESFLRFGQSGCFIWSMTKSVRHSLAPCQQSSFLVFFHRRYRRHSSKCLERMILLFGASLHYVRYPPNAIN